MTMGYDENCYKLAFMFLSDQCYASLSNERRTKEAHELAEAIQFAIEAHLSVLDMDIGQSR